MEFKEGDMVTHKLNNVRMMVIRKSTEGDQYECRWFNFADKKWEIDLFHFFEIKIDDRKRWDGPSGY